MLFRSGSAKRKIIISTIAVFALIIGILAYGYLYIKSKIYSEISIPNNIEDTEYKEVEGITNVLLIGTDGRTLDEAARADSIIIATLDKGEIELINELKMNVWTTEQINKEGTSKVINDLLTLIKEKNIKNIHLSYDIDCLDPDYVPGTGTPVNDGLTYSQSKELLEAILGTSLVKSMDFVEYNPMLDKKIGRASCRERV